MLWGVVLVLAATAAGIAVGRWARRSRGSRTAAVAVGAYVVIVFVVLLAAVSRMG